MPSVVQFPQSLKDLFESANSAVSESLVPFVPMQSPEVAKLLGSLMVPPSPEEAAAQGAVGLGPGVITSIPRPFKSESLERIAKYAPSFSKKTTGAEILSQLEARGVLPKGYGEYYQPPSPKNYRILTMDQIHGTTPGRFSDLTDRYRLYHGDKEVGRFKGIGAADEARNAGLVTRDQLLPYLQENWVNPRIDVKSRGGQEFLKSDKMRLNMYREELDKGLRSGSYTPEEAERYWRYAQDDPQGFLSGMFDRDKLNPRHEGSQTIFGDQADDYFELFIKPRRGLDIPTPEKLKEGGHWNDPSVMVHVRGETVGPRAIVQEVQGDWNRVLRERAKFNLDPIYIPGLVNNDPASFDFIRNNREALIELGFGSPAPGGKIAFDFNTNPIVREGWYGPSGGINQQRWFRSDTQEEALSQIEKARQHLGNVPPLPPELSKAWPEVGAKAALAYAARDPNLQRVSFVDEMIAAATRSLDPEKTTGIYGNRLPQFLRKYAPKHGGEYYSEPGVSFANQRLTNDLGYDRIADRFLKLDELAPVESKLHTVELGDWNSAFRKFLRGQQPLALAPTVPLGMEFLTGNQEY